MTILFVTGTGTDVGKTVATAAIAAVARGAGRDVAVAKPAQTGFPGTGGVLGRGGDLDDVAALTGITDLHGFVRYPEPMAPLAAARRAGMGTLSLDDATARVTALDGPGRTVLVEGAGGLLVRLGADGGAREWSLPDLAARCPGARVIVVASLRLGGLNEAELTVEVARARGLDVAGLVAGSVPRAGVGANGVGEDTDRAIVRTNLDDLPHLTGVPLLGAVPAGSGSLPRAEFVAAAPGWFTEEGRAVLVG